MRTIRLILGILISIAVAACGGGGSYGDGSTASAGIYSISGAVSGGPSISGVTISLTGTATNTTTTDAGGNYSFAGLVNGSYTVTPSLSTYTFTPASAAVDVYFNNPSGINFTESP